MYSKSPVYTVNVPHQAASMLNWVPLSDGLHSQQKLQDSSSKSFDRNNVSRNRESILYTLLEYRPQNAKKYTWYST
jgi:hypothetical protein